MEISDLIVSQHDVKGKILVVDDQIVNVKIIKKLLQEDYDIFMATDGDQVIDVCMGLQPDMVLLDIEMPTVNGFEVCKQLKANPLTANIAVIFITAHFEEATEVKGLQLGAVDFIHKPINPIITKTRVKNQLRLKQQSDLLRSFAMYDALTGVANRRQFDQRFAANWRHCVREKEPISIILLDIDVFKQYNDNYGHQQGDNCLAQVAKTIQQTLKRPCDLVARYGGEEFVCILPQTDFCGAEHKAKSIVDNINALKIEHGFSNVSDYITISAGVATVVPHKDMQQGMLLELADKQLYLAKSNGRNQVASIEINNIS
ncbi:diguanylate cyclase [Shewanella sp. 10N.286.48.B5]|uniref:GGDEF domain-containing response regulator n=1 Tax=Shewanella sp. 10N.286.48.B5 TaxID=1880834 RepID=UPI000C85E905|nr:diguanylate cyclase [Shewanella sp. 10N.286.48.B5]PMH87844.1 diguanylate cyclase response regulator [Shewanella sp. 10N.286.48.B5]